MSKVIKRIFFFAVLYAINIVMLIKWVAPALNANLDRGYYDAFSLIFTLCGNNPDDSFVRTLNINDYDSALFMVSMLPGVIISWMAFFTIYKMILLDAPFFLYFKNWKGK
ncbi:TPA: hypothetical protein ACJG25_004123 [Salmonella enterica subsp. enterica serovar Saintpaul]